MEQFLKENLVTVLPIALILIWFVITCIKGFFRKKWMYIVEIAILSINIICNILLVRFSTINFETAEKCLMAVGWAVISGLLLFATVEEFYYKYYSKEHR